MISLFDLHCDTLLEAYNKNVNPFDCDLHISLKKAKNFYPYVQITSIWSDYRLDNDDAFKKAIDVISYYKNLGFEFIDSLNDNYSQAFILGIEDARLLNNDISRLDALFELGVKVITLNWKGSTCIGGGYDTELGLTDFGKSVVCRCAELGIAIDLSHSSINTFNDVIYLASKYNFTPIASHSNSFSVCNHARNLNDEQFKVLAGLGSVVGICLSCDHIGANASIHTILKHILYYLKLGGKNSIALGCDFDGVSNLPSDIDSIEDLKKLYSLCLAELGKELCDAIFFKNAYSYFKNLLKGDNHVNIYNG